MLIYDDNGLYDEVKTKIDINTYGKFYISI